MWDYVNKDVVNFFYGFFIMMYLLYFIKFILSMDIYSIVLSCYLILIWVCVVIVVIWENLK